MLSDVFQFIKYAGILPENSKYELFRILDTATERGWIQTEKENGEITAVCCRWRIKSFDESKSLDLPIMDEGSILFVLFVVSKSKNKMILRRMVKKYLAQSPVPIQEIVFHRMAQHRVKKFKIRG